MQVTRGIFRAETGAAKPASAAVVTIGNFDGVHLGHQALLKRVTDKAAELGIASCVLTFEPHPREFFLPEAAPTRLASLREKLELLAAHGIDRVHVCRFDKAFAALSPETFIEQVLANTLNARHIMIGDDFRFGTKRGGDFSLLAKAGARHGYALQAMDSITDHGIRISSSAVRTALMAGNLAQAKALLGRDYSMSGRVIQGRKLGRQWGFPTANVQVRHNRSPLYGIYVVRAMVEESGQWIEGVASLGTRPTLQDDLAPLLEVCMFDFDADIYGRHLHVKFLHKIRDEEKFDSLDALKSQIARDAEAARAFFASRHK